jgi:hypothetical protein
MAKRKKAAKKPAKTMRFVVLSGKHVDTHDGNKVYSKNEVVPSATDLRKVFPNKFALFNPDAPVVQNAGTADAVVVTPPAAPTPPEPADVTADFEGAAEAGLNVSRTGDEWSVTEADDGTSAHEEPLTSEDEVNELLNKLVATEDE